MLAHIFPFFSKNKNAYQTDKTCDIIGTALTIRLGKGGITVLELLKIVLIAVIESIISWLVTRWLDALRQVILFENQIQTTSASPCRTQVQPTASFLVCSLIFIEYNLPG